MCAAAVAFARIRRLYYGASDPKGGGVEHGPRVLDQPTCHHRPEIYGGIDEQRCGALLEAFFRERRSGRRPITFACAADSRAPLRVNFC